MDLKGEMEEEKKYLAPINDKGSSSNVADDKGSIRNIPDDLVLSILSKLPFKSLKRFACVRKSWALLLDDPQFMSMFRRNFIPNSHYDDNSCFLLSKVLPNELIYISGEWFGEKVSLPPQFNGYREFYLLGFGNYIHGILCICACDIEDESVVLWNPATGESLIVPPSPFHVSPFYYFFVTHCGFGYDPVGVDHKLIRCVNYMPSYLTDSELDWDDCTEDLPDNIWEIYSVRNNTWRKLDVSIPRRDSHNIGCDVCLNGVCHWIGVICDAEPYLLVSFNLSTELVLTTPFPSPIDDEPSGDYFLVIHLGVLNGTIALISTSAVNTSSFDISILGEIGVKESWTKLFTFGPLPCLSYFLGIGKKSDIFFVKDDGQVACFDMSTQIVEETGVDKGPHSPQLMIYKESFLPIRGINN